MAFAATKRKRIKSHLSGPEQLRLTSMIDLFTIIIVFLLKSYSAVELNVASSDQLSLPESVSSKLPEETIMLVVAKNAIVVGGKAVAELTPSGDVVGTAADEMLIQPLYAELSVQAKRLQARAKEFGREFSGEITLQGDKQMPFKLLKRVMYTAGRAEFGDFRFAAYKKE